jgi:Sulfotransferase domain
MAFLIFASPKSGTTWLQRLLSEHPEAICAESRAFGDYYDPRSMGLPHLTLEKYLQILSHYFAPAVNGLKPSDGAFYRTMLFNFIDTLAATTLGAVGKSVYGEKLTPYRGTAAQALEVLHEYHPDVKFVNLTRDGRDVIVSGAAQWLNHRLQQAPPDGRVAFENALKGRTILPDDFEMFLEYWLDSARAGLNARGKFRHYLHVRYEDFIADPEVQTKALFDFLGLEASNGVVRSCMSAAAFDKLSGGRQSGVEDNGSFFRKGAVGDWRNWFSEEQERRFQEWAGDLMRGLGY